MLLQITGFSSFMAELYSTVHIYHIFFIHLWQWASRLIPCLSCCEFIQTLHIHCEIILSLGFSSVKWRQWGLPFSDCCNILYSDQDKVTSASSSKTLSHSPSMFPCCGPTCEQQLVWYHDYLLLLRAGSVCHALWNDFWTRDDGHGKFEDKKAIGTTSLNLWYPFLVGFVFWSDKLSRR
jgi:hypothetical protein